MVVDVGFIIYELCFIYFEYGFDKFFDFGVWWEGEIGLLFLFGVILVWCDLFV